MHVCASRSIIRCLIVMTCPADLQTAGSSRIDRVVVKLDAVP